jgi:hypothetical protein
VALCQARISTKPLWGFSSSNPYPTQSRAEHKLIFARKRIIYLLICGIFKSANNNWVRKSQIRKSPKVYGPQILKPQIDTFVECPKI